MFSNLWPTIRYLIYVDCCKQKAAQHDNHCVHLSHCAINLFVHTFNGLSPCGISALGYLSYFFILSFSVSYVYNHIHTVHTSVSIRRGPLTPSFTYCSCSWSGTPNGPGRAASQGVSSSNCPPHLHLDSIMWEVPVPLCVSCICA